jgi:hypothetical protein
MGWEERLTVRRGADISFATETVTPQRRESELSLQCNPFFPPPWSLYCHACMLEHKRHG